MKKIDQMSLSEYMPKSELVLEEHHIEVAKFPVIDFHTHYGSILWGDNLGDGVSIDEAIEHLKSYGLKGIVNLDGMWGHKLENTIKNTHTYEEFIINFGSIDVTKLDDFNFEQYVRKTLIESKDMGMKGLKFLKDVSLFLRDKTGNYIGIDDERLKPIWATAAELELPILIHIGDPVAFFRPVDRYNERYEELIHHPDWSFYRPGLYTFEQLMDMQKKLLESNPDTIFIIAHGGSYTENLGYIAACLDQYPNMYIDIAARISEFGRQPYSSRRFFNKYQNRIVFGTDGTKMGNHYPIYYRFLETEDEYFDYSSSSIPKQGRWKIYGIYLEDEVLEKIYYKNAEKLLFGK